MWICIFLSRAVLFEGEEAGALISDAYARDRVIGPSIPTDHGFTCTRTRGSPATSPEGAPEDGAIIRKSSRHRITGPCPLSRHNPTRRFHPYTGACGAKKRISIGSGNLWKYSLACNRRVSQKFADQRKRKGKKKRDKKNESRRKRRELRLICRSFVL